MLRLGLNTKTIPLPSAIHSKAKIIPEELISEEKDAEKAVPGVWAETGSIVLAINPVAQTNRAKPAEIAPIKIRFMISPF